MTLDIGQKAPDFTLLDENETPVTLSKLSGRKVLLYFYPKDQTPGCTQEACDFRDHFAKFNAHNVSIFGISKDSAKAHSQFIKKYALPFHLLVDADGKVCKAFDVLAEKSMFGKKYLGIKRTTFLIDENGIIRAIWRNVKVPAHVEKVLDELS